MVMRSDLNGRDNVTLMDLVGFGEADNSVPQGSRGWLKNLQLNRQPISTPDFMEIVMGSSHQHHSPVAHGDLGAGVLELAAWLGIRPIQAQTCQSWVIDKPFTEV